MVTTVSLTGFPKTIGEGASASSAVCARHPAATNSCAPKLLHSSPLALQTCRQASQSRASGCRPTGGRVAGAGPRLITVCHYSFARLGAYVALMKPCWAVDHAMQPDFEDAVAELV